MAQDANQDQVERPQARDNDAAQNEGPAANPDGNDAAPDLDIIDFDILPGDEPEKPSAEADGKANDLLFDIIDDDFTGEIEKVEEQEKGKAQALIKDEEEKQIEEEKIEERDAVVANK